MYYSKFEIESFKCFEEKQSLKLGIPIEGKPGSGITYIVGQNNSGKTSLLESLFFKEGEYVNSSDQRNEGPKFTLFAECSPSAPMGQIWVIA